MNTREPVIYPMPEGYELSQLVQQIADHEEPRAIILDFLQRTVLVHPADSAKDSADFTKDSLMFLLGSVELINTGETSIHDGLATLSEGELLVKVCANPARKDNLNYEGDILWTTIVEEDYALLVTKSSDHWNVRGVSLSASPTE